MLLRKNNQREGLCSPSKTLKSLNFSCDVDWFLVQRLVAVFPSPPPPSSPKLSENHRLLAILGGNELFWLTWTGMIFGKGVWKLFLWITVDDSRWHLQNWISYYTFHIGYSFWFLILLLRIPLILFLGWFSQYLVFEKKRVVMVYVIASNNFIQKCSFFKKQPLVIFFSHLKITKLFL